MRSGAGSHGRGGTTTGGRSHCREDSGAGSHGRGNRGPEPLPGGLGGWKPRPREPGAGATAGRTRGLEATAEGTGGQNHCREEEPEWGPEPRPCKQRRSQCKEQNTKSLTLYGVHLPTQTHTPHTPKGLSGAGSHGRGNRGLEPRPGGLWTEAAAESSRSIDPISLRAVEELPALVASRLAGPVAGLTAPRAGGGARLRTLAPVALQPDEVARWVGADHERRGVAVADACALLRERGADGADEGVAAGVEVDEVVVRVGGTPAV